MSGIFDDALFDDAEQLEEVTVTDEREDDGTIVIAAYFTCANPKCAETGSRIAVRAIDIIQALRGNAQMTCMLAPVPSETGQAKTGLVLKGACSFCTAENKIVEEPHRIMSMLNAAARK